MYGGAFDQACLVWQEKCGVQGSCWIYDSTKLGMSFFLLTASVSFAKAMLLILGYCLYKPPKTVSDNTDDT